MYNSNALTHGLTWCVLSYNLAPVAKRVYPYLVGDATVGEYDEEGNTIFITDGHPPYRIFAIDRENRVKWERDSFDGRGLDYSTVKGLLLSYTVGRNEPHKIVELDAETGKIIHSLSKTKLGPIGNPMIVTNQTGSSIHYHPDDHNKFWVADSENHAVYCTDWNGKIHYQIGTYGKSGGGSNLLKNPVSVSPGAIWDKKILISDWSNHRVIRYNLTKGLIESQLPFPFPFANYIDTCSVAVFNSACPTHYHYGTFLLSDGLEPTPRLHIPMNTNLVVPHPKIAYRFLLAWDTSLYEIDYRDIIYRKNYPAPPIQSWLFSKAKIEAKSAIYSPPIVDWFRPNKTIIVKASCSGRFDIEVASFTARESMWDGSWETIDSVNIEESKAKSYSISAPLGIFRVKVKLSGHGNVTGWINLSSS